MAEKIKIKHYFPKRVLILLIPNILKNSFNNLFNSLFHKLLNVSVESIIIKENC